MIGLVDCNNFFVSCERIFDRSLVGRPVAVLSNNDGCVIARSAELKALGIPMGEPYFRIKDIAPYLGIQFRSSNYELYGDISRRVIAILQEYAPVVEQYSIDEAFLQLTLPPDGDYLAFAASLRARILQWVGMPVSIGFANTRTLAKAANHIAKKRDDGIFLMPDNPSELLARIPVEDIWGIGFRLAKKLPLIGYRTALDLARMPHDECLRRFNICLARTVAELNGHSVVGHGEYNTATQSTTCSRAFGAPVVELQELREAVASYADTAAEKMRQMQRKAIGATIFLLTFPEYGPHPQDASATSLGIPFRRPTSNSSEILAQLAPLLPRMFQPGRRYKKAGVTFWGLDRPPLEQLELFQPPHAPPVRDNALAAADQINREYGRGTIRLLAEGLQQPWKMRRNLKTPRYTTSWDELPLVH